jgi:hypothetical protein
MLDMGLMIAAGIAAPELAPALMEGGALGIGGLTSGAAATGLTGAALGGAAGALTGQDVGKSALMGGLGGAAAGAFGGVNQADPGSILAQGPTVPGASLSTVPSAGFSTGANTLGGLGNSANPFTFSGTSGGAGALDGLSSAGTNAGAIGGATNKAAMIGGGIAGINSLLSTPPTGAYIPPGASYTGGSLSKFKYDPSTYQPAQVPPLPYGYRQMASGGIASLAMGGQPNQMYPMSQQEHTNFMNPTQLPSNAMEVRNYEPATNPMTGNMTTPMASGGIAQLAVGGKLLKGDGDGMSDSIHANIDGRQEARLADGEFVIPADVVSHLGNGSTDAGAKHLYSMMDRVRQARVGNKKQGKQINPNRYLQA